MKKSFAVLCLLGLFLGASSPVFADCSRQDRYRHHHSYGRHYLSSSYYVPASYYIPVDNYSTYSYYPQIRQCQPMRYYNNRDDNNSLNIRIRL